MATPQVSTTVKSIKSIPSVQVTPNYTRPLAIVTTLFFMWGFLTCLNDILIPHLKSIFELSYAKAMLIQFAFFSAYFLFSVPWSKIVNTIGYKTTMVVGLLTMACGAFLFVPAATAASYPLFLTALLVLAAGITGLQVSANPYVDLLGKPETASSRLDLTQAFNSLGTTIAPKIGGLLILGAAPLALAQLQQLTPACPAPVSRATSLLGQDAIYRDRRSIAVVGCVDRLFQAAKDRRSDHASRTERKRLDLEAPQSPPRRARNFRLRRRRGLDRKLFSQLFWFAPDRRPPR